METLNQSNCKFVCTGVYPIATNFVHVFFFIERLSEKHI